MDEMKETTKSKIAEREEEILKFWHEKEIFKKSLNKPAPKGNYVFYDGPPFATGLPHFGHILGSAIKDAIPRYQTMRGFHVERKWGWDCHGLPIENKVEEKLKISGKKQIEEYGVAKFNEVARSTVLTYVSEWRDTVLRIGRWVDFDGSYKTMDNSYIESVWWALKEFSDKKLIYEGTRVLPYCPRCETPIANSEIAMDNSYKDITDISVYVKFELIDEPGTYFIAWTTTPWTLPANTALAINPEAAYVKVKAQEKNGTQGVYIFAKDRLPKLEGIFATLEVQGELRGKEYVGARYKPLFDYYASTNINNKENGWKVYAADFVTLTEGTGIVHMAPGYGEEDMDLAKKENIPVVIHITPEGKFKNEVTDFAGLPVKPKPHAGEKDGHQVTDIEIIKHLAHAGILLHKEKIVHSYPHCYRCETPLYYTALPAWFVKIQDLKPELLALNEKIHWVPEHLKSGRFKKSMEGAPDWNISRNRFWASPLPIWKCETCGTTEYIDSLERLGARTTRSNTIIAFRHGESENLITGITSSDDTTAAALTEKGKQEVREKAFQYKNRKITALYASPLKRTQETAKIIAEIIGFDPNDIITDGRIKEIQTGIFNGKPKSEYHNFFKTGLENFEKAPEGGETLQDLKNRMGNFLEDINKKHDNEEILIVSHEDPIWMLVSAAENLSKEQALDLKKTGVFIKPAETKEFFFKPLPHNENFELDLHRPYIDELVWKCECGGRIKRTPEVIDCWFESGSMPFAQNHYPFENKEWFKNNFPAQFVSEYIAQTRTWFYYMHVVSTILFNSEPFEHVVTTGNVLAEDGQKMSKSKNNFPDPWKTFDKYGVDALRYYLLSSPLMKSEDLNFSEKGLDEVYKKIILRLSNVLSFYELYKDEGIAVSDASVHPLDRWIVSRLNQCLSEVTAGMESYEIDRALKPIDLFIDDLSTWYVRRSRERLKEAGNDKSAALGTLRHVLVELSKILAPFAPFIAEHIYKIAGEGKEESVHLEAWPLAAHPDEKILAQMETVRKIVESALALRADSGIKVRQPLSMLTYELPNDQSPLEPDLEIVIADELNVKEVKAGKLDAVLASVISKNGFESSIESGGVKLMLNVGISPELKEEGQVREFIRSIQDLRKKGALNPNDRIILHVKTDARGEDFLNRQQNNTAIKKAVLAEELVFGAPENGVEIGFDGLVFAVRAEPL